MNSWAAVVGGLASASLWGAADLFGGIVSRRSRAVLATLYVEALGLIFPLFAAIVFREQGIPWRDWLWCGIAGGIGSLGLLALYAALARGQISLAAPVSAVTSASLPVLVGFWLEGQPAWFTLLGFLLALVSILLISSPRGAAGSLRRPLRDLGLPLLSGVGLGIYFICMHQGSQRGVYWPMVASRVAGTAVLLVFVLLTRQLQFPARPVLPLVVGNTAFDVGGNVFFILAGQAGRMDVAVVLSSLYSGVTVLLAWLFLKEKLNRAQVGGIVLALGAIVLMTL